MKKIGFIIGPVLVVLLATTLIPRLLAGGMNPSTLVLLGAGMIFMVAMIRPKKPATKSTQQIAEEVLDDFCRNAFTDKEMLNKKFQSALSDIGKNLPKTAINKLQKLAAECTTDQETYAVAMASARAYRLSNDFKNVIREYNKAVVLNPTPFLAYNIGDCHQRLGALDKARDSYEFASELEPTNPQYPSSIGTTWVGEGNYDKAIDHAMDALALDENFPQALATMAICYGVKDNRMMYDHYRNQAVSNGYSQEKIESTVKALKKRDGC